MDSFSALADPTRRQVFERLTGGGASVGQLAEGFSVSRPAISQHLKVLKDAGLVDMRAEGTRRIYFHSPRGLRELRRWLDQFWDEALNSFAAEANRSPGQEDN